MILLTSVLCGPKLMIGRFALMIFKNDLPGILPLTLSALLSGSNSIHEFDISCKEQLYD